MLCLVILALAAGCAPAPGLVATAPATPTQTESAKTEQAAAAKPAQLWDRGGLDTRVLGQWTVEQLPPGPHMLRVTELEMEPGARVFDHTNLGPGGHVVLAGSITIVESASGEAREYVAEDPSRMAYYEGTATRHRAENRGTVWNRVFMVELLPRNRGFLGNQQFDQEGVAHNEGGVRSGPYVQEAVEGLPKPLLMVRVSEIKMGPKAKTPAYTRPGPGIFFVASGQATFRHDALFQIQTSGAGGYYFDPGTEPIVLENKPITEAKLIAVELLPASLGKGPSTVPAS